MLWRMLDSNLGLQNTNTISEQCAINRRNYIFTLNLWKDSNLELYVWKGIESSLLFLFKLKNDLLAYSTADATYSTLCICGTPLQRSATVPTAATPLPIMKPNAHGHDQRILCKIVCEGKATCHLHRKSPKSSINKIIFLFCPLVRLPPRTGSSGVILWRRHTPFSTYLQQQRLLSPSPQEF